MASQKGLNNIEELLPAGTNISQQSNPRNENVIQIRILDEYMNLRESCSTQANQITQVQNGDIFTVLDIEYSNGHTWYKVKTALGYTGFIASGNRHEYVEYLAPKGQNSVQSNPINQNGNQYIVNSQNVYLYQKADETSEVVGMLFAGETYDIISTVTDEWGFEAWYKIKTNRGVSGFVKIGW